MYTILTKQHGFLAYLLLLVCITSACKPNEDVCKPIETVYTKGQFTDKRDGKVYKTVNIGNQIWMAENLAYKADTGCWAYNLDTNNVLIYGYMYNWKTANQVCPDGWHLPSKAEWQELHDFLCIEGFGAAPLRDGGFTGFNVLLGGQSYNYSLFEGLQNRTLFWTSSSYDSDYIPYDSVYAWHRFFLDEYKVLLYTYPNYADKNNGFYVRCVKN